MSRSSLLRLAGAPGPRFFGIGSCLVLSLVSVRSHAAEIAHAVPATGLVAYVEYDGLDRHASAWKGTAAFAAVETTPAGTMLREVGRQVLEPALRSLPAATRPGAADLLAFQARVMRQGFALGIHDEKGVTALVVLKGQGGPDAREATERLLLALASKRPKALDAYVPRLSNRKPLTLQLFHGNGEKRSTGVATATFLSWFEGDDLIVVAVPQVSGSSLKETEATLCRRANSVLDTLEGKTTSVENHPGRAAALAEASVLKGCQSNGVLFVEAGPLGALISRLEASRKPAPVPSLPRLSGISSGVKYFDPGPAFPWSNTQAAIERAKQQAKAPKYSVLGPLPPLGMPITLPPEATAPPTPPANSAKPSSTSDILPPELGTNPTPPAGPPKPTATPDALPPELEVPQTPIVAKPSAEAARRDEQIENTALTPGPMLDQAAMGREPQTLARLLGIDGITRIVGCWGFQGKALLTGLRIEAPAPRRGVLSLLDQPGFRKDQLPLMAVQAGAFLVGSLDVARAYDVLMPAVLEIVDPSAERPVGMTADGMIRDLERAVRNATGVRLREDLIDRLGPTWSLSAPAVNQADGPSWYHMPVLRVGVDDADVLAAAFETLTTHINAYFQSLSPGEPGQAGALPFAALEHLPAPERGYRLTSPSKLWAYLGEGLEPTILIGESFVVVADTPHRARAAFQVATRQAPAWVPSGEIAEALGHLPDRLIALAVGDPINSSWPRALSGLPRKVQYVATVKKAFNVNANAMASGLSLFGVPRPGDFFLRIDPGSVPSADAIRAHLFPRVAAAEVDDRGLRLIAREALPLSSIDVRYSYSNDTDQGECHSISIRPSLIPAVPLVLKVNMTTRRFSLVIGLRSVASSGPRPNEKQTPNGREERKPTP